MEPGQIAKRKGRFAPSPTGPMHEGNARTALLAWLHARLTESGFVLRMEDLDLPRVKPGSATQILEDLRWMGLDWDEGPDIGGASGPYEQSKRGKIYTEALAELWRAELLFPCFCSRKDLMTAASAPHSVAAPYPGTCRSLTRADAHERSGRKPALRFRVPERDDPRRLIVYSDGFLGPCSQDLAHEVGDFVVMRADGLFAYQLAVVVDDALMGVTDVVRGADLQDSSARQIALFEALAAKPPRFWHVPLVFDGEGKRMAKRDGSAAIAGLRAAGVSPGSFVGRLAESMGLVEKGEQISAKNLLKSLNIKDLISALSSRS